MECFARGMPIMGKAGGRIGMQIRREGAPLGISSGPASHGAMPVD